MSVKERILHMVLFEAIALVWLVAGAVLLTGEAPLDMTVLAVLISLIAMTWNYAFNVMFDRAYGYDRINRSARLRLWHGVLFETGLTIVTLPLIMVWLDIGFWIALVADIGMIILFMLYAILYNWAYDNIRYHVFGVKTVTPV